MAWTLPRTWVTAEVVTAAQMNAHVRDNFVSLQERVLGWAQVTANQTGISSEVDLTGLTKTVSVDGAAVQKTVMITAQIRYGGTTIDDVATLRIKESTTVLAIAELSVGRATSEANPLLSCNALIEPTSGSHTYKLSLERSVGTGNMQMVASSTHPAFILIEDIGYQQ